MNANRFRFRAWHRKMAVMLPVWNIDFACPAGKTSDEIEPNEITIMPDGTDGILVGVDTQAVLMQSTGLTDKNGKEIFEGDIVRISSSYLGEMMKETRGITPRNETVEWDADGYFRFSDSGAMWYEDSDWKQWEVIGNIYENHNLLPPSA